MSVIILLIVFSIIVAGIFLLAFIWAVRSGQYDDTESPSIRILFDNQRQSGKQKARMEKTDPSGTKPKNQSE